MDFTKLKRFQNSSGEHLSEKQMSVDTDNFLFPKSSKSVAVSRRDDLVNMCYMMLYLFTNGNISKDIFK